MALQTETHSPPSSTSAVSSAPASSPSDPADAGGFSLSASPPLILAFLAVGMFAISMVVFFGWRRIAAGRVAWVVPPDNISIGETPKLWDVWSPRERAQEAVTAEWHNIQPLAATVWDHTPPLPVPVNNDTHRHHSLAAEALAHLRRRYRRRRASQDDVALEAKLNPVDPLVRLQVAVTIAMPCPDFTGTASRTEPDDDDEQPLEYSIGLYETPWKKTH
ncbi:hypothetical protein MVEN_00790200 [Mycena venus]|uniref:Uncharacterized protein n=1 Tax=Mycena venus TaxID=2733690 RepID=A0A8H6YG60_9AGAR|nr:hypothetical protein MVEN_00790200 [Mycena venus]